MEGFFIFIENIVFNELARCDLRCLSVNLHLIILQFHVTYIRMANGTILFIQGLTI